MRLNWLKTTCTFATLALLVACGDDNGGTGTATDGTSTGSSSGSSTTSGPDQPETTVDPSGATTTDDTGLDTSSSGSPADSSSETGAAICPDVGEPCTQCESTTCSQEYCDCYNNGSCVLLSQCALQCDIGDTECYQACWSMYPDGISDAALLTHCAATVCMPECGPFIPLTECQQCLYGRCPEEMNVCISNPDCTALLYCLDECELPGCENGCYALYPGGLADSGPVGECAQEACTVECV